MASNEINITVDKPDAENASASSVPLSGLTPEKTPLYMDHKGSVGDANGLLIYKVPRRLREVNKKAYKPIVISIGPYHYDKKHLKAMEDIKRSCFNKFVKERGIKSEAFVEAMKRYEKQVRKCYEGNLDFKSDKFVEMMVHDGFFIVQLIRKKTSLKGQKKLKLESVYTDIRYDLLLLENQLPFFFILKLYSMIAPNDEEDPDMCFTRSALSYFDEKGGGPGIWLSSEGENCFPPRKDIKDIKHLLYLVHNYCRPSTQAINQHQPSWKLIRNATQLKEAGINFFAVQDQNKGHSSKKDIKSLLDIEFEERTKGLKIPTFIVDNNTERILRNLMAYEQFIPSEEQLYASSYVMFMNTLINTSMDVQLLCNSEIINNRLGDNEAVAQMFNKLGDFIYWPKDFYYAETFNRVSQHCERNWNKYKATLKREYFNTPWSFISFLAAVVLLLLTVLQTTLSVLSYFYQ